MSRNKSFIGKSLGFTAALALAAASGAARADDNSMSMWTGESYAYFNGLDYSPGSFNVPRGQPMQHNRAAAEGPGKERPMGEREMMLATTPAKRLANPFRDDTGA